MKLNLDPRYQVGARNHLVDHDRAAAFMGIGLGKTATTLDAFHTRMADAGTKSMLVVAPLRVANLTWPNEIKKWDQFRGLKVEKLREVNDHPSGKANIYLTNYERLPKLKDLSAFDGIVFDELTKAKNPGSDRINHVRSLLGQRPKMFRWGLTGTPRPNSLTELFAQVRLLDDGKRLGVSYNNFLSIYFDADEYAYKYTPRKVDLEGKPFDSERRIYEKIHDLAITLRSSDYLDIPDTIEEDVEVPLPAAAHEIYKRLERELMVLIESDEVVAINAAVLVNKFLQICGGAVYATNEQDERKTIELHGSKLVALKRLLVDLKGESALIACNFVHERLRILRAVPGAVDAHTFKGDLEDAWNTGSIKYLVFDPRALGHGLNMQAGGRNVIWYSPCWSRELYDQCNGRVARKGQGLETRIWRLLCPQTMDDCVVEALRTRGDQQTEMLAVLTAFREQGLTF